jgi:hypothetical protein
VGVGLTSLVTAAALLAGVPASGELPGGPLPSVSPSQPASSTLSMAPGLARADTTATPVTGGTRGREIRDARAVRVDAPPIIDGRLDDPAWQEAEPLGGFVQRIPSDGAPASEPTEVRVLYDEQAIYVGVWLWDSNPQGIVQGPAIRDSRLDDSDAVVLIFDTYRDRQNGFVFGTNPSGIEYDGQVTDEGRGGGGLGGMGGGRAQGGAGGGFNLNWDGSWEVATSRDARGWYAEFRIPFNTLRYASAEEAVWGFNVMRRIRRFNEESYWAPIDRQYNLYRVSQAGELRGLEVPVRRQATVTPYVLQSAQRDYRVLGSSFDYPYEVGGDAKVQVTQGLTLDLTLNTDFAQVEVDNQQVNLTRFSLSFPEKRPFFLENAGYFRVGSGGSELFFSRRIGIEAGAPVPIRGGGRLSGRAGGFNVGLLHIQTGLDDPVLPGMADGNAFSVVRVARELPNRSLVGTYFGERRGRGIDGDWNRTYAVDGQVGVGDNFTLSSFAGYTDAPSQTSDARNHVVDVSGVYLSRALRLTGGFREMGADFNPEVGFVNRRDYRMYTGMWMVYLRPDRISWLREIRPHSSYNTFRSLETGFEQSSRLHVDSHFEFSSGAHFEPAFNWVREGLTRPFEIVEGVVVEPGTYEGWEAAWRFNTNRSAPFSISGSLNAGSFLSGSRVNPSGSINYRHGSSATLEFTLDHNQVKLAEGDFDVTLAGLRAGYFFTPRVYLQSLVQYADQTDSFSANVRFGWLNTAGTGLFIVYNENQGINALSGPQQRSLVIKYNRQFNVLGG